MRQDHSIPVSYGLGSLRLYFSRTKMLFAPAAIGYYVIQEQQFVGLILPRDAFFALLTSAFPCSRNRTSST